MKSKFIISVLCFGFLLFGAITANAATLTVTKIADTNDNVCDADCSLREAIFAAAASGDTIEFASPLFDSAQTMTLALGALYNTKTLTINGRSAALTIIHGNNQTRVFLNDGNVTLNRMTFTGGKDFGGSGIYNDVGSSMILNDSIVSGNTFSLIANSFHVYKGAGIYNAGSSIVTINGSNISNNVGNNIRENAGIGIGNDGAMTITNSSVSANRVLTTGNRQLGGGIHNNGTAVIINTTISGNTVTASNFAFGGGIYSLGALTLINSTVSLNTANSNLINPGACNGGGIFQAGTLNGVNTIISGNTSCFNADLGGSFTINTNNFVGGDAKLTTLSDNGGATQTHAFSAVSPAMNAGNICVLTANSCGFTHPALANDQRGTGFPRSLGAAVDIGAFEYGTLYFTPAILSAAIVNVAYSQQINVAGGIAAYNFTLESGTLPSGISLAPSGLLSGTTAQNGAFNFTARATDSNGAFTLKNYVLNVGYYVINTNNSGTGSLRQLIIDTPADGTILFDPAYFNQSRTIALNGEIVINKNLTLNGTGAGFLTIDAANASRIFNIQVNNTLSVFNLRITRGNAGAGNNGGCIYVAGVFNLIGGEISNCAANFGGAIYNEPTGTTNLIGSTVSGSQATNSGGAIFDDGLLLLTDSIIENNNAGGGGAIYVQTNRTATILRSIVRLNTATGGAGGIYNVGTLNFTDSTASGNTAQIGGGVLNDGDFYLINSTLSGNRATTDKGAGIYNSSGRFALLLNATITNNQANSTAGAGIWNENFANPSTTVRARNSIIAGNISGAGNPVDYVGGITNLGNNLINNSNPGLAPLGNYGGTTPTHALLPNSPALNAGDNCALVANTCGITHSALTGDQRGTNAPRKIGASVDIGAFERNIVFDQTTLPNATQNSAYSQTLTVTRLTSLFDENQSSPDNLAPFTFSIISTSGQSLPNGLTLSSAGIISGTPTTIGSFTFTVRATDTDGIVGVQQYTIAVANTPPTITASGISRVQSSPVSNSTIATVNDLQSGASGVTVTVTSANPSNGVTISTIVNTNGTITANAVAACGATNANFTLTATDGGGATATATLTVTVTANTAPTLVYPASFNVSSGGSINVSPTTATDNGTVSYSIFSVSPVLTTAPTVDASGVVSITNANPVGNHTITIRSTDVCNLTTNASFTLNVMPPIRTVTKIADTDDGVCDADCSLREAIATSVSGDTIQFAAPLFNSAQTITLASELSVSGKTITITGRAANLTTVSGNNANRVFNVGGGGNLTLDGLTVTNGRTTSEGGGIYNGATLTIINSTVSNSSVSGGSDNFGGGIYNASGATLTIRNSTISGNLISGNNNFANRGGGIANVNGSLTITNSTVSGNLIGGGTNNRGGGIYSEYGPLTIINDTITGNVIGSGSFSFGGGLAIVPDGANLVNTIISGNSSSQNPDVVGGVNFTTNFIGGDARLAPLGFYGGTTQTHALLSDSPVLNIGNNCVLTANACTNGNPALTNDQRGGGRIIGETVDIGAFESNIIFNQTTIPNGDTSLIYSQQLSATRQTNFAELQNLAPTTFEIVMVAGQSLPPGITLSSSGLLSGTPTMAGNYTFTVKATDTDGIAGVKQYSMQVFAPTAASVSISGRVLTADGRGLRNAFVVLTDASGNSRTVRTTAFGFYYFEDVSAGQTYTFNVRSKNFQFAPRVVNVTEDLSEFDFTAL